MCKNEHLGNKNYAFTYMPSFYLPGYIKLIKLHPEQTQNQNGEFNVLFKMRSQLKVWIESFDKI